MRFSALSLGLALAAFATASNPTDGFNPIRKPGMNEVVAGGTTYEIRWDSTRNGTISIDVIGGLLQKDLKTLSSIAKGIDSNLGKFAWAVDGALGALALPIYGLNLTLDSNPDVYQYSDPFVIKGTGSNGTTASASASASQSAAGSSITVTSSSAQSTITSTATTTAGVSSNSTTTRASSATSSVSTGGAYQPAAASLAIMGGLAAAVFAL